MDFRRLELPKAPISSSSGALSPARRALFAKRRQESVGFHQFFAHHQRADERSQGTVSIDVLAGEKKIGEFRAMLHPVCAGQGHILLHTVETSAR